MQNHFRFDPAKKEKSKGVRLIEKHRIFCRVLVWAILFYVNPSVADEWHKGIPETIGIEEGLSQNTVNGIYKDKEGFIWIATGDGLNRYNGHEIKVYRNTRKKNETLSNLIRGRIAEDSRGNIWFGTESGFYFVNKYSSLPVEGFSSKKNGLQFTELYLRFILRDTLWFTSYEHGIGYFSIDRKTYGFYPWPDKGDASIPFNLRISTHAESIFYIGADAKKIYSFNCRNKKNTIIKVFNEPLSYFTANENGNYYFSKENKIYTFSDRRPQAVCLTTGKELPSKSQISGIIHDKKNRLWIGTTRQGLHTIDLITGKSEGYGINKKLPLLFQSDMVTHLYLDCDSLLWVGTDGGGVVKIRLKDPLFSLFPQEIKKSESPMDYFTKCILEDDSGKIWLGTFQNGIIIIDKTGKICHRITKIGNQKIRQVGCLYSDNLHQIWISADAGTFLYKPSEKSFESIKAEPSIADGTESNLIYRIVQIGNEDYLCGSRKKLLRLKKNNIGVFELKNVPSKNMVLPEKINDILSIGNNRYLLSAPPFGLYLGELASDTITITTKYLEGFEIRSVTADKKERNICWIATASGLVKWNDRTGKYRIFDFINGMPNENCYCALPDDKNNMWISTNNGICLFERKSESFLHYTKMAGLQSAEFNSGAYHKGKSGILYFGGINGVNWIHPKSVYREQRIPYVALSEFKINDIPSLHLFDLNGKKRIKLKHEQNHLYFYISALDFSAEKTPVIKHMLKGWDQKPIFSRQAEIYYQNLSPGKYIFEYSASDPLGVFGEPQRIFIQIDPPFWNTPEFIFIPVLTAVLILYVLIRYMERRKMVKARRELEKERLVAEERLRISSEMHDDIGAGLTRISLMSEAGILHENNHKKILETIHVTTAGLVENMGHIIWSLSDESKSLSDVLAYIREMVSHLVEFSQMKAHFVFESENPDQLISQGIRRNLLLTIKELTNNAVKYSRGQNLQLEIKINPQLLIISVRDDGIGFNDDGKKSGQGLSNIQKRTKVLGGKYACWNDKGACFRITIPLN